MAALVLQHDCVCGSPEAAEFPSGHREGMRGRAGNSRAPAARGFNVVSGLLPRKPGPCPHPALLLAALQQPHSPCGCSAPSRMSAGQASVLIKPQANGSQPQAAGHIGVLFPGSELMKAKQLS